MSPPVKAESLEGPGDLETENRNTTNNIVDPSVDQIEQKPEKSFPFFQKRKKVQIQKSGQGREGKEGEEKQI